MMTTNFGKFGVFLTILVLGGGVAGARPAQACAMGDDNFNYVAPRRAEQLLVAATAAVRAGLGQRARTIALRVAMAEGPSGKARAQAWAIAGWGDWQQGARTTALRSFGRAKRLDKGHEAIDSVLAMVMPSPTLTDLRQALAG